MSLLSCNGEEDGALPVINQNPELLEFQENAGRRHWLAWMKYVYTIDPNLEFDPNYEQDYQFKSGTITLQGWKGGQGFQTGTLDNSALF